MKHLLFSIHLDICHRLTFDVCMFREGTTSSEAYHKEHSFPNKSHIIPMYLGMLWSMENLMEGIILLGCVALARSGSQTSIGAAVDDI
jgi:hypothetical protein